MKKLLVNSTLDFYKKVEEFGKGDLKIINLAKAINILLTNEEFQEESGVYIILNNTESVVMVYFNQFPPPFDFVDVESSLVVSRIPFAHISRLFIYTKQIFLLSEE